MTTIKNTILAIVLMVLGPYAHAQSIGDILALIEQNNLDLQALRQEKTAEVTEAQSRNQLSAPSLEYSPFFQSGISGVASSEFIAQQEFDFPTIYAARRKTAKQQASLAEANYRVARRDLLWEAEQKLIDYIEYTKNRELLQERYNISKDLRTVYEKKLDAGDATIIEMNKIKIDCMTMETELIRNEISLQSIASELEAMNGGKPLQLDSLTYPAEHIHNEVDGLLSERRQNDAELISLREEQLLATRNLKEAKQSWLPNLSVGYRRNTDEHKPQDGFLVGMSFPLYSQSKQVKAAKARQASASLREEQARIDMETEVKSLVAELNNYQELIKEYDLDLLHNSLNLLLKAVNAGEINVIDYYTEAENIYEQWISYIHLEHDCQKIHAQIHQNEL